MSQRTTRSTARSSNEAALELQADGTNEQVNDDLVDAGLGQYRSQGILHDNITSLNRESDTADGDDEMQDDSELEEEEDTRGALLQSTRTPEIEGSRVTSPSNKTDDSSRKKMEEEVREWCKKWSYWKKDVFTKFGNLADNADREILTPHVNRCIEQGYGLQEIGATLDDMDPNVKNGMQEISEINANLLDIIINPRRTIVKEHAKNIVCTDTMATSKPIWEQEAIPMEPYNPEKQMSYCQWRRTFMMMLPDKSYHEITWRNWILNKAIGLLPMEVHDDLNHSTVDYKKYLEVTDGLYYKPEDARDKLDELWESIPSACDEKDRYFKIRKFLETLKKITIHIQEIDAAYQGYYSDDKTAKFSAYLINHSSIRQIERKMPSDVYDRMLCNDAKGYRMLTPLGKINRIYKAMQEAADMASDKQPRRVTGSIGNTRRTTIKMAEVNVNSANVERKRECRACGSAGHNIFSKECSETRGKNEHLAEILAEQGTCVRCIRRLGPTHDQEHCGFAVNKKENKTYQTDCKRVPPHEYQGTILNRVLCGCYEITFGEENHGRTAAEKKVNICFSRMNFKEREDDNNQIPDLNNVPVGMIEKIIVYDAKGQQIEINVQYDTGAQMSLIPRTSISQRLLSLDSSPSVEIKGFDGKTFLRDNVEIKVLKIKLEGDGREKVYHSQMIEVPNLMPASLINTGRIPIEFQEELKRQSHKEEWIRPDIILGQNCGRMFPVMKIPQKEKEGIPGLYRSAITGKYLLYGLQSPSDMEREENIGTKTAIIDKIVIENTVNEDFTLWRNFSMQETIPMQEYIKPYEADPALMTYVSETSHQYDEKKGRWRVNFTYHAGLLVKLPLNDIPTLKRMYSMLKKTSLDMDLAEKVSEQVEKNVREGIWTPVVKGEFEGKQKHFLPINFVMSGTGKKQKVRLVCDPSMRGENGLSLNHVQLDLAAIAKKYIPDIKVILIQARTTKYLALGDIASFFNNFILSPEDQALRLLLLPKDWTQADGGGFTEYATRRLPFGDQQSAYLAIAGRCKAAMTHGNIIHDEELRAKVVWILLNSVYVDDIFAGSDTIDELYKITNATDELLSFAGMKVKSWAYSGQKQIEHGDSLSEKLEDNTDEYRANMDSKGRGGNLGNLFSHPQIEQQQKDNNIEADDNPDANQEKFLGYAYEAPEDVIVINYSPSLQKKVRGKHQASTMTTGNIEETFPEEITKVQILRILQAFFDPLGVCLPLTMRLRFLFSRVCQEVAEVKGDWNSAISEKSREELKHILKDILSIMPMRIPRSINLQGAAAMLVLTDGSLSGYGYVVYLRTEPLEEVGGIKFLTGRAKIKGSQALTAPRSELLAAHLAAQDINKIKEATEKYQKISRIIYMTDSMVVLCQLRKDNNAIFSQFVTTRLLEIQKNTDIGMWNHIPGNNNVADLITRDNGNSDMMENWLKAEILTRPSNVWGLTSIFDVQIPEKIADLKDTVRIAKVTTTPGNTQKITEILKKHTKLDKALLVIAYIYRFAIKEMRSLTLGEIIDRVKNDLIEAAQMGENMKKITPKGKLIKSYQGIAYLVKRQLGTDPRDMMHMVPIIPRNSALGDLLIRNAHYYFGHVADPKRSHMHLCREYYVIGSFAKLKALRKNCPSCAHIAPRVIKSYQGAIPKEKLIPSPPFHHMQIDVFGPVEGRHYAKVRTTVKFWGLMIVCMYTRAVSCHVMENYSADEVVKILTRHASRYGQPRTIFADNGTNIKAMGRIILTDTEDNVTDASSAVRHAFPGTSFVHGPPAAPWSQGSVERMIGIFKGIWRKYNRIESSENKNMSAIDYETLFARITNSMNDRPLFAGDKPEFFISPNDLLHSKYVKINPGQLDKKWVHCQAIDQGYRRWMKIFSRVTTQRRIFQTEAGEEKIQIKDIVLILDLPNPQTGVYRIGEVIEVITPRKIKVKFYPTGDKNPKIIERHSKTLAIVERPRKDQQT